MAIPMFTPEELEELRRADAELDETFVQTIEEFKASSRRDREALRDRKDAEGGKESDRHRAYYEENREKTLEKRREGYKANRERKAEYARSYRADRREQLSEWNKAYYQANREAISEKRKAYYKANREKIKQRNREYHRRKKNEAMALSPAPVSAGCPV